MSSHTGSVAGPGTALGGDATEAIVRELTALVRGLKDLHRGVGVAREGDEDTLEGPSFVILWRIGESGPLRVSSLADALYVDISTVSRQLGGLEEAGWVARQRDPADARAFLVDLTEKGRAVLDRNRDLRLVRLRRVLADWSDADRDRLARDLARFNAALAADRTTTGDDADEGIS